MMRSQLLQTLRVIRVKATNFILKSVVCGFFVATLLPSYSHAQDDGGATALPIDDAAQKPSTDPKAKGAAAQKNKKTTIDFEDQLIEGSRQKPELFYLLQNKDFNYKRLIRLREDFLPELRKTGEDVQSRSGSGK